MALIEIRHVPESNPPRFYLRGSGGKATAAAEVLAPGSFQVEGRANSSLVRELGWYLEEFLEYPFSPETEHAERVLDALRTWGEQAFEALFGDRDGGVLLAKATAGGYEELLLQVWSDDARILAWPWEALRDPKIGAPLAATCRIERRLNDVADPAPVPVGLPTEQINILLVIARPLDGDVKYRSIARPLVELIEREGIPAYVHVLRPPTFDQLREHLGERPGYYHLVHFDGHGNHGKRPSATGEHAYGAAEGELVFETMDGKAAPITAEKLSALLREHKVPGVVLNACRSAMHGEDEEDPFASVAAALLRAGTRSVVAMSYSLYVSGAQQFLPAFYKRLFERGSFAEAARAGRQQMFAERGRVCARGRYDLQDWLVPVVYQQEAEEFSFKAPGKAPISRRKLPKEAVDGENPYGFVGRDGAILEIERALRRPVPAILIHGLGGVGKTTLARGLVEWLAATKGLGEGCIWLSFQEIRSAEYVLNQLGEKLFTRDFGAGTIEEKIDQLGAELKKRRHILIWDNFETVIGITGFAATFSETDRGHLKSFLQRLRGGATKVIITSRSEENWLGTEQRRKGALGGFDGEERWTYADAILGDLGITINRGDKNLVDLIKLLDGHPLAMRVVLPRLEKQRADELSAALRSNLAALGEGGDEAQKKLHSTLKLAEDVLPEDLKPLLIPLGMHERFVQAGLLELMAKHVDESWTRDRIDRFLGVLANAGLLRDRGQTIYEMHPALTGFLRTTAEQRASEQEGVRWSRSFVGLMRSLANQIAPRELHEQRFPFHLHLTNIHYALSEAARLRTGIAQAVLVRALLCYALNTRKLSEAKTLTGRLFDIYKEASNISGEAVAYYYYGIIAQMERKLAVAEDWFFKALAINENQQHDHDASLTLHQLGSIAREQRNFAAADTWYRKSLVLSKKQGNDRNTARIYLDIGILAHRQHALTDALEAYNEALKTYKQQGDEHSSADAYYQLGMLAYDQCDFTAAEAWSHEALAIMEKQGDERRAANIYHQLGMIAEKGSTLAAAEAWYRKSLAIKEKRGNRHSAASTYGHLGLVAGYQGHMNESGRWLIKSARAFMDCNDPEQAQVSAQNFLFIYTRASPPDRTKLEALWKDTDFGELPILPEASS